MPTRDENRKFWGEDYDWSDRGESWTPDEVWRRTILDKTLVPYLKPDRDVLEIGPGYGRWTKELVRAEPRRLVLVDLAERCIEACREMFGERPGVELHLNDGCNLAFLTDDSIDFIWSFDVFVHIEHDEVRSYFEHFARVLRQGGVGIVHYATIDRAQCEDPREGWRADFTSTQMFAILDRCGLELVEDLYDPHISHTNSSVIVFGKPAAPDAD